MPIGQPGGRLVHVFPNPPIEVICEISSLEEPIRGRLSSKAGRSMEFRGWIEFSTALMSVARGASQSITNTHTKEDQDDQQ